MHTCSWIKEFSKHTLALIFLLLFLPHLAHAKTLTVTPGQSIQSAINSAVSGDIIQVRAGTYPEALTLTQSGVTLTGYPGEMPIIDGQDRRGTGLSIKGNNITVANLKVTNHTGHDIDVRNSTNTTLEWLEVYVTGRALFIQNSSHITVRNSTLTTPTYIARQTDGIYSQKNKNNVYENNTIIIYNSHEDGHDDAIQMYEDESIIVRGNYLAQVTNKDRNAQGLYATTMHGTSLFYNNIVDMGNSLSAALTFRRLPELGGNGTVEIVGNTVVANRSYHAIWVTETDNPIVKNNISYVKSGEGAYSISGSKSGVSHNLTSDPKFVNLAAKDYHLQPDSPAVNAGVTLSAPYNVDKDGHFRVEPWDIGAYESGTPASATPVSTPTPTPPPASTSPPTPTPTPAPLPKLGDANSDHLVNETDYTSHWFPNYLKQIQGVIHGDYNSDNVVDGVDYVLWLNNYGK